MYKRGSKTTGFTLIELVVSIAVMGAMSSMMVTAYLMAGNFVKAFNEEQAHEQLIAIKSTLLDFAGKDNNGALPVPYMGSGYNSSCLDITNAVQKAYLNRYSSVELSLINTDSSITRMVRTCQRVSNIAYVMPVAGFGGESVNLSYDAGVVYQTLCPFSDVCNAGLTGASGSYTATGWTVTAPDFGAVEYTTLAIQQSFWYSTYERLLSLRNTMMNYRIEMIRTNASDDVTNWNIAPNLAASHDYSGASASANQGCYDGWYDLSDTDDNILPLYGLNQTINGVTITGASIEYCRDYDPAINGANTPPNIIALRINRNVSTTSAPDNADVANNFLLSF